MMFSNECIADLQTDRGEAILMGRVKINKTPDFNFEIPLLSFIVIKREDGSHIATCIHLLIDGYGATVSDASEDMIANIGYYLRENFKNEKCREYAWHNLYEMIKSSKRSGLLWDKYHALQIELARKNIPADMHAVLRQKIKALEEKTRSEAELRKKLRTLENEFEKVRNLEAALNEKVRRLEAELNEKEKDITYWITGPLISEIEDGAHSLERAERAK